jgi:hypothetical protein
MTEAYHANSTGGASCSDEGAAAALGSQMARGYADLRNHGAEDRCSRREPDEYALLGLAWVSADRKWSRCRC